MDWEKLTAALTQEQRRLQDFVDAIKTQQEAYRPGSSWDALLERSAPFLLHAVEPEQFAHPNVPLAAMAVAQIKFNQAVISLLTDLDHRKTED